MEYFHDQELRYASENGHTYRSGPRREITVTLVRIKECHEFLKPNNCFFRNSTLMYQEILINQSIDSS